VSAPFLLCDPAIVGPAPDQRIQREVEFWTRLIEWADDKRVAFGPFGLDVAHKVIGERGWPDLDGSAYPPGLGRLVNAALSRLLQRVREDDFQVEDIPTFDPTYTGGDDAAVAIGWDAIGLHRRGLLGIATSSANWSREASSISFDPPPPQRVDLALEPKQTMPAEIDIAVTQYLRHRRLTIVGGIPSQHIINEICGRFGVSRSKIEWIGSEPGTRPNLAPLDGLQAKVDVVYLVTGHIGHDGSTKAKQCCRKRGTLIREIRHGNDLAADLCQRHGKC
jgi:hypothetical protein